MLQFSAADLKGKLSRHIRWSDKFTLKTLTVHTLEFSHNLQLFNRCAISEGAVVPAWA